MATEIEFVVSQKQSRTKRFDVGLTPLKKIFDLQAASQCGTQCPICHQEGQSGACSLDVGHTQEHQCSRVSTHRWSRSSTIDVPGPH